LNTEALRLLVAAKSGEPLPCSRRFNGRLRDECLNAELFSDLVDARTKLAAWRQDYNENRPHGSIGNLTPIEFARSVRMDGLRKAKSST